MIQYLINSKTYYKLFLLHGERYWDLTSDPYNVNLVLSR